MDNPLNLRTLVSLCALFLLLAGCDRWIQESKKKPEPSAIAEPATAPQVVSEPEALQSAPPEPPAAVPAKPTQPYRIGGEVTRPEVIHKVPLDFSALANTEIRLAGINVTEAVIDEKGNVQNVRTLKGSHPEVDAAVIANVRQWKFNPATLNGKPVPVYYTVTVNVDVR